MPSKGTAAIRQLAYGVTLDVFNGYSRISDTTAMKKFCRAIVEIFSKEYQRKPNADDIKQLLKEDKERGLPGMLGSLDCMHWVWKNCPVSW